MLAEIFALIFYAVFFIGIIFWGPFVLDIIRELIKNRK